MARAAAFHGVNVAAHDPDLKHGACFYVGACGGGDCYRFGCLVNDVHLFVWVD